MHKSFIKTNAFIHDLEFKDIPADVLHQARRCLLDLLGVWIAGSHTKASHIACRHAVRRYSSPNEAVPILLSDGARVSPPGAAFAGATTIDSIDGHDGHQNCKGHAGAALLPALFACIGDGQDCSSQELLTTLVIGYEIAIRSGLSLHATVPDYHSSGSWNSIGCAAIGARIRQFDITKTRHALGIAEYFGPRAQMMRCIDHPAMVKDSTGWGAMVGMSAVDLAEDEFTGAPAVLCEADETENIWNDLGASWRILETNFKTYPVCRWAQPAIEGLLGLKREHDFEAQQIEEILVTTFHEATRLASTRPKTCDEAQYSLPFSLALAAVTGGVNPDDLNEENLDDTLILKLADRISFAEKDEYNAAFPDERYADVKLTLHDGRVLQSPRSVARGNHDAPPSDKELVTKFHSYAEGTLSEQEVECIMKIVTDRDADFEVEKLITMLSTRPEGMRLKS